MWRWLKLALASCVTLAMIQLSPAAYAANCSPTITSSGAYTILKFTSLGTCTYTFPSTVTRVEYLAIGGGGGGGNNAGWGGGGGSYVSGVSLSPSTSAVTVTVGDGGAAGIASDSALRDGQNGEASSVTFSDVSGTALGGLGGPTYWSSKACSGGSQITSFDFTTGGRNGGAGGIMASNSTAGNGGAGYSVTVTPPANIESSNYSSFAGGGGGGKTGTGTQGTGVDGGGAGGNNGVIGTDATSNTGGGGGGGGDGCKNGGKGGSGIVIMRYFNEITYPNKDVAYPSVTGTLLGRYQATNFNGLGKKWTDSSSSNNHITEISGSPYIAISSRTASGNSASDNYAVTGITSDKFALPISVANTYTVFNVARYTSTTGSLRERILSTVAGESNWLSGFYRNAGGITGLAYHDGWITQTTSDLNGTSPFMGWVISTDKQALHRSQRVDRTTSGGLAGSMTPRFAVNRYTGELSDWQMLELIVYSTALSDVDIAKVEDYLYNKYMRGINYSTLTVAAGPTPQYRVATSLTVDVRTQSRVTYKVNGKVIAGCNKVLSSSTQATCSWLPSLHSQQTISATSVPLDDKYDSTTSSASVYVVKRTSGRHS